MPADTAPSAPPALPEAASAVRTFLIADVRGCRRGAAR